MLDIQSLEISTWTNHHRKGLLCKTVVYDILHDIIRQSLRLYKIVYISLKDASHGDWYYNGDEFGGIFKGQFDILKALKKKIFFYLLIEL